ncbi:MAG: CpsD/CapB family tyrosine-protein kinase [Armatimonadota bacterium]
MTTDTADTPDAAEVPDTANRFFDPWEPEKLLGVPTLGFLPRIDEPTLRLIRDISSFSPLMESFRTLRTNLYFATEQPLRSLAVMSSVPAEGKSTTTANLAMALAMDGKKVIVVDADLRRPTQHKLFQIAQSPGLVDLLTEEQTVKNVLRQTNVPGVRVITAGAPPPNAPELLGSGNVARLLAELERHCDIVLLDTPPVLAVADGPIVASQVGGVLLVIGYGETKKENTAQCMQALSRCRANVLGTALNRMQGPEEGYYYGKYYVSSETTPELTAANVPTATRERVRVSRRSKNP